MALPELFKKTDKVVKTYAPKAMSKQDKEKLKNQMKELKVEYK